MIPIAIGSVTAPAKALAAGRAQQTIIVNNAAGKQKIIINP